MAKDKPKSPAKPKPGPKAEVLKFNGNWQDAVRRSFQAKKPAGGWPGAPTASMQKGKGK